MSIIGVDHVQLAVPPGREARAREVYCDVLELPERIKPPELGRVRRLLVRKRIREDSSRRGAGLPALCQGSSGTPRRRS